MKHNSLYGADLHIARFGSGLGSPSGVVTPGIKGEGYFDETYKALWISTASGDNTAWTVITEQDLLDTTNFTKVLSASDTDVQIAFNTLDKVIDDTSASGVVRKTWSADKLTTAFNSINTERSEFTVNQASAGFSSLMPIYFNIDTDLWTKAKADSEDTLSTHIVTRILTANSFNVCQVGKVTITAHGKAQGFWFTSDTTEGETVDTSPLLSNPVFFVEDANTVHVLDYRPLDGGIPPATNYVYDDVQNTFLLTQLYNGDKTFTLDNEIVAKKYVDDLVSPKANDSGVVHNTGVETIAGIKTFSSFPVTPSVLPTTSYQVANKLYVDEAVSVENLFNRVGTTLYPSTSNDNINIGSGNITGSKLIADEVDLNITLDNPLYGEGKVFYDKEAHALAYYNEQADVTVNVGQEVLIQVRNETGITIPNGAVVYPTGFNNGEVLIGLALSSDKEKCRLIGMVTHEIEDQTNGYVTKIGVVNDLNTSAYASGDVIYLSPTVPGGVTKVKPLTSNYLTRVGAIKKADVSVGSIVVDTQTSEYTVEALEDTGWSKDNLPIISFTDGILTTSRYLTITATDTSFCFYQYGDKYCKATDTIRLPDEEGMFVVYYNMETLAYVKNPTSSQVEILIKNNPLVAYVYWDATNKVGNYVGQELHKIGMACETHVYLHFAFGARYLSGLAPNTVVADGNGDVDSSAQFGIDSGAIADEDIYIPTPSIISTTGLPIAYLLGTSTNPVLRLASNPGFSVLTTGTGRLAYNQLTGGNYQLTEVASGDFALYHIIAINENLASKRVFAFMGQNSYTTLANARAGAITELAALRSIGILPQEIKAIATFIYETQNAFDNAVKSRVRTISTGVNYVDWRTTYLNGSNAGSAGGIGSTIFDDSLFQIIDNADATKVIKFEASAITTGNTRIISVPDRNLILNDVRTTTTTNFASGTIPFSTGTSINVSTNLKFDSVNNRLIVGAVTEYTDNASAVTAGLAVGSIYRTGDILKIVHV